MIVDPVMDPLETHGRSLYTNNFELAIATLIALLMPFRINTRTHSNVRREEAARCSASCVYRSDRSLGAVRPVAAGRTVTKPTNVSPGRPVEAGARRVVLGSAGHLERP